MEAKAAAITLNPPRRGQSPVTVTGGRRGLVQSSSVGNMKGTTRKDRVRNEVAEGENSQFAEKIALKLAAKKGKEEADKVEATAASEKWANVRMAVRAKPAVGTSPVLPAMPPPPPPRPEVEEKASSDSAKEEKPVWMKLHSSCRWGKVLCLLCLFTSYL